VIFSNPPAAEQEFHPDLLNCAGTQPPSGR
jgi:hypothetical protein